MVKLKTIDFMARVHMAKTPKHLPIVSIGDYNYQQRCRIEFYNSVYYAFHFSWKISDEKDQRSKGSHLFLKYV